MDWRVKSAIRHSLLAFPAGDRAYRWLTVTLLGTNAGMAYKWFRVFPAHIRVLNEQFSDAARVQRLWCYDSGATMAAGLAIAIASDAPGLLTDRYGRLQNRYCAVSRRVLQEKGDELARLSGAPAIRVADLLADTGMRTARAALAAVNVSYDANHAAALAPNWLGTIGCVFSAGTLEHYTPEMLERQVAAMARALKPGGVMSHVVDHRDHRWHADKTICPLDHLRLDGAVYDRCFANALDYHNRWLRGRYLALFARHGFLVTCADVAEYTPDLPPLARQALAPEFRNLPDDDLRHLVTHFVAVKAT